MLPRKLAQFFSLRFLCGMHLKRGARSEFELAKFKIFITGFYDFMRKKNDLLYFINDLRPSDKKRIECEPKHILIMRNEFVDNLYQTLKKINGSCDIPGLINELVFPEDSLFLSEPVPLSITTKKLSKKQKTEIEKVSACFKKDYYFFYMMTTQFWNNPKTSEEYGFEAFLKNVVADLEKKIQKEETQSIHSTLYKSICVVLKKLKYGCDIFALIVRLFPEIAKHEHLNTFVPPLAGEEFEKIEAAQKLLETAHAQSLSLVREFWNSPGTLKRYSFKNFIISVADSVDIFLRTPQSTTYLYEGEEPIKVQELPILRRPPQIN